MIKKLSPHVTIYKFPIAALSSIATRISGVVMSTGFIGLGMLLITGKNADIKGKFVDKYKPFGIFISTLTLSYHTLGGLRHFILDANPKLLTNKSMTTNSFVLFTSSTLFSSIFTYVFGYNSKHIKKDNLISNT
jgi:succinate dehydrogenase cytochrome b556 subunit|tara:strand:- start:1211 stop:1612 length:402 start_codon:yes stop_codon:yes gene_type:complete